MGLRNGQDPEPGLSRRDPYPQDGTRSRSTNRGSSWVISGRGNLLCRVGIPVGGCGGGEGRQRCARQRLLIRSHKGATRVSFESYLVPILFVWSMLLATPLEIASMYNFTNRVSLACGKIPNEEYLGRLARHRIFHNLSHPTRTIIGGHLTGSHREDGPCTYLTEHVG